MAASAAGKEVDIVSPLPRERCDKDKPMKKMKRNTTKSRVVIELVFFVRYLRISHTGGSPLFPKKGGGPRPPLYAFEDFPGRKNLLRL
jgi:hypothetical protein